MDYKDIFGLLGVLLALGSYAFYIHGILSKNIKPHAFSWLVWTVLGGIAFAAQVVGGAEAGSWVLCIDTLVCTFICILAFLKGEKGYTRMDWISLFLAGFSLVLWWITKTPTLSVCLIILTDFFGFVPTYRKAFEKPFEESAIMFAISSFKFVLVLIAVETYSIATSLYPLSLVLMNGIFVGMLLVRRSQKKNV